MFVLSKPLFVHGVHVQCCMVRKSLHAVTLLLFSVYFLCEYWATTTLSAKMHAFTQCAGNTATRTRRRHALGLSWFRKKHTTAGRRLQ